MKARQMQSAVYCWETHKFINGFLALSDAGLNFVFPDETTTSVLPWRQISSMELAAEDTVTIHYDVGTLTGPEYIALQIDNPISKATVLEIYQQTKIAGQTPSEAVASSLVRFYKTKFETAELSRA